MTNRFFFVVATFIFLFAFTPAGPGQADELRRHSTDAVTLDSSRSASPSKIQEGKIGNKIELPQWLFSKFKVLSKTLHVKQAQPGAGEVMDAAGPPAIAVMFDHPIAEQSIQNTVAFHRLQPYPQNNLPGKVVQTWSNIFAFYPNSQLNEGATYRVVLKGGAGGPHSTDDRVLSGDVVWEFTTKGMPASPCNGACFGTICQQSYQNEWQEGRHYVWNQCAMFNDELDDTDTKAFYYNFEGAIDGFTTCDGCDGKGVDTVHLLYINTHGQAVPNEVNVGSSPDACFALWAQKKHIFSKSNKWRFGDEKVRNAFFAQYACETLKVDDNTVYRWLDVFRGGMIMALGSHGTIYDGETTDECGEDFADGLQKGKSVKWAWFDGLSDWYADQDVAVLVSGSQLTGDAATDCAWRRDNVKWQNFGGFIRWRDEQVNHLCMSWIDDH